MEVSKQVCTERKKRGNEIRGRESGIKSMQQERAVFFLREKMPNLILKEGIRIR
jgi:hypothetical protein